MSFILDALRKVDHESRQGSDPTPPVVAIARLNKERVHRRRQLAVMAAIAMLSAVSTAVLMRRSSLPEVAGQPHAPGELNVATAPVFEIPVEDLAPSTPASVIRERQPEEPAGEAERQQAPEVPSAEPEASVKGEAASPAVLAPEAPPEPPLLVLQGTSILDGKPVAVVSDRRVFEGDTIEGAVVIRIDERSVELEFQGRRFTLTF